MPIRYFSKLTNPDFWKKPRLLWLGLIVLVGLAVIVLFMVSKEPIETSKEPKVVPSEVVPLASGKRTYEIITGSSQKFKIIEADIDPLDVKQGETQVVTVRMKDSENNPITQENQVEAVVYTDNTVTPFSFSLKKVEDSDLATVTTWEGSWVCEDTYDLRYTMNIEAKSATQEHSIGLAFR
ncbi:hypothetical protein ES703_26465 [subsurface metagenome]